jgi:hypothetical protein
LKVYKVESSWGVAPNPTFFFALMPKRMQKKSRLRPLRNESEKLKSHFREDCRSDAVNRLKDYTQD